jgi:uncharacterized protein (TIGR00251 family)
MSWFRWEGDDLILCLRIQPNASRDAFLGPYGEQAYKVTLTAAPVDGKANAQLIKFLAKQFDLPRSRVEMLTGGSSRNKRLRLKSPNKLPIPLDESIP